MKKSIGIFLTLGFLNACSTASEEPEQEINNQTIENPTNQVILSSEIEWEQLNPARGDQSPQAGTIWGDRKDTVPTGFLAKFVDGFSSPPHIHNVTYRAVVIKGLVHNDDAAAANFWMTPGSFWTQPLGEAHITSAKGEENIALVEIDKGPYLVKPTSEAFDNGERPINIDASNIVWLDQSRSNWIHSDSDAKIAFLLDDQQYKSLFIKLPKNYQGTIETRGSFMHAVIIQGDLHYLLPQTKETKVLDAGSYFTSTDLAYHSIENKGLEEVIIYIRTNGTLSID